MRHALTFTCLFIILLIILWLFFFLDFCWSEITLFFLFVLQGKGFLFILISLAIKSHSSWNFNASLFIFTILLSLLSIILDEYLLRIWCLKWHLCRNSKSKPSLKFFPSNIHLGFIWHLKNAKFRNKGELAVKIQEQMILQNYPCKRIHDRTTICNLYKTSDEMINIETKWMDDLWQLRIDGAPVWLGVKPG